MSKYEEILNRYKRQVLPLSHEHRQALKRFRLDPDTPLEQKEDDYMANVWPKFDERWGRASSDFVADVVNLRKELEKQAYGTPDPMHSIALANTPDDKLAEVLATAKAAGDTKLQESVVATARTRGQRELVNGWVESNHARKTALSELNELPAEDRLEGICKGHKPPHARSESLAPDHDAIQRQVSEKAAEEATRAAFFQRAPRGGPTPIPSGVAGPRRGGGG